MKRIFQFITAIAIVAPVAISATSEPSSQTEHVSPFACNALALSPEVRKRHFEELGPALLKLKKSTRELPDGYEFELPADDRTYQLLTEWAFQERLCCPFLVGRFFGWDHEPAATAWQTFATRLTDTDHSRSLAPAGTRNGFFRVVYRFENEQLVELINRTAHAAALSALVETATAYRFYFGVYVWSVSRFTPFYMTLIDPFRKLIVYPSLLRSVRARWNQAFGAG